MNKQRLQTCWSLFGVVLVAAWGQLLPVRFNGRMPQASGGDVLALVLGEARLEISRSLTEKADEYFHGGVRDLHCDEGIVSHAHAVSSKGLGTNGVARAGMGHADRDGDHDEGHDDHDAEHASGVSARGDLWRWIDSRVHEQTHRHLKSDQMIEVLPWFWAASRVSGKNTEAYESGAYVLAYALDKPEEGVKLLEEGVRNNPAAPSLDFMMGEILLHLEHDSARAEPWFTSAHAKARAALQGAKRTDEQKMVCLRSAFYLGYLAKQRGDWARVRAFADEAESLAPENVVTHDLRSLLKADQPKP